MKLAEIARKSTTFLMLIPGIPLALLARLIRPWIHFRVGILRSERIGHFSVQTELYLCEKEAGLRDSRSIDLFFHNPVICNQQLRKMWDRVLYTGGWIRGLYKANSLLPGAENHLVRFPNDTNPFHLIEKTKPHLSFTTDEESLAQAELAKMGIPPGAEWICISARDSAFLDKNFPGDDFHYHDYRDCNILHYMPAIEWLARKGHYVVRMGAAVKTPLPVIEAPWGRKVIDYANLSRSEFMDIYLTARCRFMLSSTEGIHMVPSVFRKPVVVVNDIPLGAAPVISWNLLLPKQLKLRSEARILSLKEVFARGLATAVFQSQYDEAGVEVLENTPDEILEAVKEMEARVDGSWKDPVEVQAAHSRYQDLMSRFATPDARPYPPLSTAFLSKHTSYV